MMKSWFNRLLKWLRKKTGPSGYTETNQGSFQSPSAPTTLSKGSLHRSTKTLRLNLFIRCLVNKEFECLIISGQHTVVEIMEAWDDVFFEYCELLKGDDSDYLLSLTKKITLLEIDISYVDGALMILEKEWDEELAQKLNSMLFKVRQDNSESFEMCRGRLKRKLHDLSDLHDEYKKYLSTKEGKAPTEEDFEKLLIVLSKYQGYPINSEEITVYKYIMILNNYISHFKNKVNA